jgi:hypothetical protein
VHRRVLDQRASNAAKHVTRFDEARRAHRPHRSWG